MGSSRTIDFSRKQNISKEELIEWDKSLRDLSGSIFSLKGSGGILANEVSSGVLDKTYFQTTLSLDKVDIAPGIGLLNVENTPITPWEPYLTPNNYSLSLNQKLSVFDYPGGYSIPVPTFDSYGTGNLLYIGFVPKFSFLEQESFGIDAATNQVATSLPITHLLRDQSTGVPSKVRFFNQDGTQTHNTGIYEVVSIINSTQFVISGSLVNESGVYMNIVGSYDLASSGGLIDKTCYMKYEGELTFTTTKTDITNNGGFVIAELYWLTDVDVILTDKRVESLFNINLPFDTSYWDKNESFTGQKEFKANKPIFNTTQAYSFNIESVTTPLPINSLQLLTLPTNILDGAVYNITANPNNVLTKIVLGSGWNTNGGDRIYLKVDNSSPTLSIRITGDVDGGIRGNGQSTGFVFIPAGTIIELLTDNNNTWTLMNLGLINDTGWVRVTNIVDSTPVTPISINTSTQDNGIYWRIKDGVRFIKITRMDCPTECIAPLIFYLPTEFANADSTYGGYPLVTTFDLWGSVGALTIDRMGVGRVAILSLMTTFIVNYIP